MTRCRVPDGGGQEPVQGSTEGAREPKGPADFGVPRVGGDAQDTGLGQFPGAFGQLHPRAARVGRHDFAGEPEFGREVRHGGGAGGEGLRPAVQRQAAHHVAAHAAAPGVAGLQDRDVPAGLGKFPRRQQAGDAAAHHHGRLGRTVPAWLRPPYYSGEIE